MLPVGIALCDLDGNITDKNPRYAEITQFPAQAPSDYSSHSNLNAPSTLSDRRSLVEMTLDLQSCIQSVEWYFVPSLGKVVSYLLSAIPLDQRQEEGSVLLVLQELMNPNDLTNLVSTLGKA
jgi:hypothetical protein